MSESEWLDIDGAQHYLGDVGEKFVRRLVYERRVRYFKVGKFLRFRPTDLDEVIVEHPPAPRHPLLRVTDPRGD